MTKIEADKQGTAYAGRVGPKKYTLEELLTMGTEPIDPALDGEDAFDWGYSMGIEE